MVERGGGRTGVLARLRTGRRRVALISAPQSPRARLATLVSLLALTLVVFTVTITAGVSVAPPLTLLLPLVVGSFLLDRPALQWLILVVAVAFIVEVANKGWDEVRPGSA